MICVLCGELERTCVSRERISSLKSVFENADTDLYVDNICRKKNESSVIESLSALWGLVRLAERMDIDLHGLALARTESGKPYFKNSDLHFSLSHTRSGTGATSDPHLGYFACALSKKRVGIDIEVKKLSDQSAIKVAERFFSARELEFVRKDPQKNFTLLWTAKESCTKLLGTVLSEGSKRADIFSDEFSFRSFEYGTGYVTICADESEEVIFLN